MEILTISMTGTLGMVLVQIAEQIRPWLAQRGTFRALERITRDPRDGRVVVIRKAAQTAQLEPGS